VSLIVVVVLNQLSGVPQPFRSNKYRKTHQSHFPTGRAYSASLQVTESATTGV